MPPPWLGCHVSPSSSLNDIRLVVPDSCEVKIRFACEPVLGSQKRIGSSVAADVGAVLSSHVGRAGDEQSSKLTRYVLTLDWKKTLPVFRSTPIEGSPALLPRGAGAK